jgi:pimeloyl-ACP methyl ester carboxylesterase
MYPRILLAGLAAAFFAAGCADHDPVSPLVESGAHLQANETVRTVTGRTGPGALYAFHVPAHWNGSLVLYVHGFRDAESPVDLRDQDGLETLRQELNARGFAVGYSSFSQNGWAVRDGAQRTHQLNGLFAASFGRPARTYLIGHSLGSLVTLNLVERFPAQYAGALPVCGILGGGQTTINYIANIRLLFDFFYPAALPGDVSDPQGLTAEEVQQRAVAAIAASPMGAFMIQQVMGLLGMPIPAVGTTAAEQLPTLLGSIVYALAFHVRGFEDLMDRTHGRLAFDNTETDYVLPLVQNNIPRYAGSPDALNYLQHWYEPSGRLGVPVISLDGAFDPIAPLFHKDRYAAAVAQRGASEWLDRMVVPTYGHCEIPAGATLGAFARLVQWVETGVRP